MAIDPELLEILACPVCRVSVTLTREGTGLRCGQCFRVYPIVDDIPVMLVEEAVVEKAPRKKPASLKKKAARPKPAAKKKTKPRAKPKAKSGTRR